MTSLLTIVLVLSTYLIPPGIRPIYHAAPMQVRCSFSATRPGGYATAVQIECSHSASRLIRLAQRGVLLLGDAEMLDEALESGDWQRSALGARHSCLRVELKSSK
jgi:hypothetical protein